MRQWIYQVAPYVIIAGVMAFFMGRAFERFFVQTRWVNELHVHGCYMRGADDILTYRYMNCELLDAVADHIRGVRSFDHIWCGYNSDYEPHEWEPK